MKLIKGEFKEKLDLLFAPSIKAVPQENLTSTYIANVSRLTGIPPDEPIGIPSDQPARWMAVGVAMAIQENGTESLDYFAMLRGWGLARPSAGSGTV
jgi:hypothetical protein